MTIELWTAVVVLACPVLIVLALVTTTCAPDRTLRENKSIEAWLKGPWFVVIFAMLMASVLLSVPHKGDVSAITSQQLSKIFTNAAAFLGQSWAASITIAYAVIGLVWSILYFWLYARGLGLQYVLERDLWLQAEKRANLEGLSDEQRKAFTEKVLNKIKGRMLYDGDFPLRPMQQKRFFGANLTLWPVTLTCYLIGDFALDIARRIAFAFRKWIHRYWEQGMSDYLADEALCHAVQAQLDKESAEKEAAAAQEKEGFSPAKLISSFMPGLDLFKRGEQN